MITLKKIKSKRTSFIGFRWNGDLGFPEEFHNAGVMKICDSGDLYVDTCYGTKRIKLGDWIVKDTESEEFSVINDKYFDTNYKLEDTNVDNEIKILEDLVLMSDHAPFCKNIELKNSLVECTCMDRKHYNLKSITERAKALLAGKGREV